MYERLIGMSSLAPHQAHRTYKYPPVFHAVT
jgi:hypothetical protein